MTGLTRGADRFRSVLPGVGASPTPVRRLSPADRRFLALLLSFGAVSAVVGWAIAADRYQLLALVPVAAAVAAFSLFDRIPFPLVLAWLATGPALLPFARFPWGSGALVTLDRLVLVGLGVTVFSTVADLSRASRWTRALLGWLIALTAVIGFRVLLGTVGDTNGLKFLVDCLILPGVAFAVVRASATSSRRIDRMLLATGIGGALAAIVAVAESRFGFSLASFSGGIERFDLHAGVVRYSGPYAVPEIFTVVLLCSLAATLCWARRGEGRWPVATVLSALQLVAIYLTLFRTGWAVALVVVVGSLAWGKRRNQTAFLAALAAAGLAVAVVGQLSQGQTAVSSRLNNSANSYARIAAYEQGLDMIAAHPLIGVGIGGYPIVSREMAPTWFAGRPNVNHPHNSLIQVAAEAGIFALFALLGLAVSAVRLLLAFWRRTRRAGDDRLAVCGALTLAAYFLFGLPFSMLPYGPATTSVFVILGLCAARLDRLARR